MPELNYGRSIVQIAIAQGGAGTTDLVAAPGAGLKIYVVYVNVSLSAAGTIKFTEGTGPTDLTGAMDIPASGGFVAGEGLNVCLSTNTANSKLSIVSTTGAAKGWLRYFIAA